MEGASKFSDGFHAGGRFPRLRGRGTAALILSLLLLAAAFLPAACSEETDEGPSAPEGFTATAGSGKITLTWDEDETVDSYNLYWATAPSATEGRTEEEEVTSPYSHTGLTAGTTYYYVLTAVQGSMEGPPCEEVSAVPD